jgi:hypothetical protein
LTLLWNVAINSSAVTHVISITVSQRRIDVISVLVRLSLF